MNAIYSKIHDCYFAFDLSAAKTIKELNGQMEDILKVCLMNDDDTKVN